MSSGSGLPRGQQLLRVNYWRDRGRGGITEDRVREEIIKLAQLVRQVLPVDSERVVRLQRQP